MNALYLLIPTVGLLLAMLAWMSTRRIGTSVAIFTMSMVFMLLINQKMLRAMGDTLKSALVGVDDYSPEEPKGEGSPAPTPSATPSETPSPTPEPAPHNSSPPPWEWIGFVAAGLVAAVALTVLIVFLLKALRRNAAKRKIAKRKAIERQKLHARHRAEWSDLLVKEKTLGSRWLEYEDSPKLSLKYPIMRQLNDPKIAPVIEAMGRAKAYRTDEPTDLDENPVETEYAKAVAQFEVSLDAAERYAKKVRWNNFAPEERKKAQQALKLLNRAMDTRNYPAERKTAYERVARIMEDLMIPVSPRAILAIEDSVGRLELTA